MRSNLSAWELGALQELVDVVLEVEMLGAPYICINSGCSYTVNNFRTSYGPIFLKEEEVSYLMHGNFLTSALHPRDHRSSPEKNSKEKNRNVACAKLDHVGALIH